MKPTLLLPALAALALGLGLTGSATRAANVSAPTCPSRAPKFASGTGSTSQFLRPGAKLVRLCRYYGSNWGDPYGLRADHLIQSKTTISYLTRTFNSLQEPPRGIFCVRDDGSEILLVFAYAGGVREHVVVKLSGCRYASNGRATRSTTPGLHSRLLALSKG